MSATTAQFAGLVGRWQPAHGRSGLPWQGTRDPYRVWLSEIMLQQTQVASVLAYYPRFLERFPDVAVLAAASLDDVLGLWSGLGYYSRARNLHRCACEVVSRHGGRFPSSAEVLQTLPGIGRSTAAAIAAFCFNERAAILDGNVKRVLTRLLGFEADLATAAGERALWSEATALLPEAPGAMPVYTQALMDLGATVCTAREPACSLCPVDQLCVAHLQGNPRRYPVRTKKLKRSAQSLWLLRAHSGDAVWLEKRPTPGVWAGLYCFPVFASRDDLQAALSGSHRQALAEGEAFVHVLTHKDLHLHPVVAQLPPSARRRDPVRVPGPSSTELPRGEGAWFGPQGWAQLGLPAPIRRLLAEPQLAMALQGGPALAE